MIVSSSSHSIHKTSSVLWPTIVQTNLLFVVHLKILTFLIQYRQRTLFIIPYYQWHKAKSKCCWKYRRNVKYEKWKWDECLWNMIAHHVFECALVRSLISFMLSFVSFLFFQFVFLLFCYLNRYIICMDYVCVYLCFCDAAERVLPTITKHNTANNRRMWRLFCCNW